MRAFPETQKPETPASKQPNKNNYKKTTMHIDCKNCKHCQQKGGKYSCGMNGKCYYDDFFKESTNS